MPLWEFALGGAADAPAEQSVIAAGGDEDAAARSALALLGETATGSLVRPGTAVPADQEGRWREMLAEADFPTLVSNSGRLARYARRGSVR